MNRNKEYWIKRAERQDKKVQKDIEKTTKKLKKEFTKAKTEIKKELAYLQLEGEITDFQKYRLEETLKSIDRTLNDLYNMEENLLNERLIGTYRDIYEDNLKSLNISFTSLNEELIREVVKTNWSGLIYTERITEAKRKIEKVIKEELTKGLIRGDSIQDMARVLEKRVNTSYSHARTLVHTETCWVQNRAAIDSYKEADLEKAEFIAFIDQKTTEICREHDGRIILLKDAIPGVNVPPLHFNCRSALMPVIE